MRLFSLQECGHLAWSPVSMQFALATSGANITEAFVSETSLSVYSLDIDSTTPVREFSWPFVTEFTCLLWSTNDSIVAGFEDGSLSIGAWNDMGNAIHLQAHGTALSALSCSEAYSLPLLATGSTTGEVSFWDLNTRTLWHAVKSREGTAAHHGAIVQISWNPKVPKICCTASQDGTVSIWDMDKKGGLISLRGDGTPLISAIFSPDIATVVFTVNTVGLVSMWDLRQKTHPVSTSFLQLPPNVIPESMFTYQYGKTFLCVPTSDGKCFFFLPRQTDLLLIGSDDSIGTHINASPFYPGYFLSQACDTVQFSSRTEGYFIPSLIPLTLLSNHVETLPSPVLLHPLFLFAETCPDDISDNYDFVPQALININSRNVMIEGRQQHNSTGLFLLTQVHDAGTVLSQIEQVLAIPVEAHSCPLPSYKDLSLQPPNKVFRALLSAGPSGVLSWLTGAEASPKVDFAKQIGAHPVPQPAAASDGRDFFDDIQNSFPDSFPENEILELPTSAADRFSSYYSFLYNNDLGSAAACAANNGDFALAFYIASKRNDKKLLESVSESFKKAMNSSFIKAVDSVEIGYAAIIECLPPESWFYHLKIAASYGGEQALKEAAANLLQKSSSFSPALLTALTILAGRVPEAFELAASTSNLLDTLVMSLLCVSQGVPIVGSSAFRVLEGLINIVISQGDENLAAKLRTKFSINQSNSLPQNTSCMEKVQETGPSSGSTSITKQGRRTRSSTIPQINSSHPSLSQPVNASIFPVPISAVPSTSSIIPGIPPNQIVTTTAAPSLPYPTSTQAFAAFPTAPQINLQPPIAPSVVPPQMPHMPISQPLTQFQPSVLPLESPQMPVISITQPTSIMPISSPGMPQPEMPVTAPPLITAPAPPTVDGAVSAEVVQVATTTAPQTRALRRQPTQSLSTGQPLDVIRNIATNGSANAERFKALVLRYAEVDQMGFLKYYSKLGDCIIHLAEQGVLSADTISVLGRYIAGLEMGNGQAATEAIKTMAARKQRLYTEELSAWAAPLKIMARALCK
ncbi:Putative WD-repeat family protein [Giardia duodenalis]|uniref:Sec31 n=2 Tax=Giardia intestinalis TaxID=5741 RepID=C6LPU0_GIAIB|nr:Sec31 [Giardia intestinalis ATCC 50581]ESU41773.1 Putative WD-repeat family protein [Giardia intestinalis]